MSKENPPPSHMTRVEREEWRDRCAMRVLPWCLLMDRAELPKLSFNEYAARASERAYLIADAMLMQRNGG